MHQEIWFLSISSENKWVNASFIAMIQIISTKRFHASNILVIFFYDDVWADWNLTLCWLKVKVNFPCA
jgi:hypothetical protein